MGLLNIAARAKRNAVEGDRVVANEEWYVSQGSHPFRCGPAVYAMGAKGAGAQGVKLPFNVLPWTFTDIQKHLAKAGVPCTPSNSLAFNEQQLAITRIDAAGFIPHFVVLTWAGDELKVHDPLSNTRLQTTQELTAEMIYGYYLILDRVAQ